jgi:cell division protein FtsL
MIFLCAVSFGLIVLYLHGGVQADLILRQIDELEKEQTRLQHEVNGLRSQINTLKRYDRIVRLARKQGLVDAPPFRKLPVDMRGMNPLPVQQSQPFRYAGIWPGYQP